MNILQSICSRDHVVLVQALVQSPVNVHACNIKVIDDLYINRFLLIYYSHLDRVKLQVLIYLRRQLRREPSFTQCLKRFKILIFDCV